MTDQPKTSDGDAIERLCVELDKCARSGRDTDFAPEQSASIAAKLRAQRAEIERRDRIMEAMMADLEQTDSVCDETWAEAREIVLKYRERTNARS